ncbi:MAG: hypothetical protein K8T20_02435 [Planctomycetes bacterium]|nr:hypothetical protein [Planctomycetota bacterium]
MTISRALAAAFLFATVSSAFAEDSKPPDEVFVAGLESSLRGEVLGFRDSRLEIRIAGEVMRVATRCLRCVRFGGEPAIIFEEDFPGTAVGPRWEEKQGNWTVKDGVVTGTPANDVAVLELRESVLGDGVLDLDAEIHSRNPRGGLHVTFAGQHWFLYPQWSGIYPPYQEVDGSNLWSQAADGEFSFQGHFRFARTGTHYEFTIDGKPFHQVESTPREALEGKLILSAAHRAEVKFRNLRVTSSSGATLADPEAFKTPTDIQVWLAGGKKVMGSLLIASPDAPAMTLQVDGKEVPLTAVTCLVFLPREAAEPEFELDAALRGRMEAWVNQLGDEDYEKRDAASRRLTELGPFAFPVVSRATSNPDPEIAARADLILQRLKHARK